MDQLLPHDVTDLRLAPVALRVDERLDELGTLPPDQLAYRIALETDKDPRTEDQRGRDLVAAATHMIDLAGWTAEWDPRGVRLRHGEHTLVLGVTERLQAYVRGG